MRELGSGEKVPRRLVQARHCRPRAHTAPVTFRVLSWNLFHGRDFPPDPKLRTWRSRLLRLSERNDTHLQVNRDLLDEFAALLRGADWDLALLQECPPRWHRRLAQACGAVAHRSLTSRNSLAPLRRLAAQLNPDLIASNEGGSNLTLVRTRAGSITERRELELRPGPHPERRTMAFTRVRLSAAADPGDTLNRRPGTDQTSPGAAATTPICVANLHASAGAAHRAAAEDEVRRAAERACAWAGDAPLILGGDLNLRPQDTDIFDELERRYGLRGATAPHSLDHLLARDLDRASPPLVWPPQQRELRSGAHAIRLSDHAPVEAEFTLPATPER